MTDPERGDEGGAGENMHESRIDKELSATTPVDLNDDQGHDDSKVGLINANGGAGTDHIDIRIQDPAAASSDGEVSFNGLGKDEVMRYADEPFWKRLRLILFIIFWCGWFAMLITAVLIIAMAPRCPPRPDLKWYQKDSVYQVLPQSFKDSNKDGNGDFEGLKSKMSYIDDLGSKSVWISDIYKTDGSMKGIIDHLETRDDFAASSQVLKAWIKKLAKEGKKVILDLVPNQTSKKHEWFIKSQNKEGRYTDFYVWRKSSNSSPPNSWTIKGKSGNPAWTKDAKRGEWYFHQLGTDNEYADLNLDNEDVVEEIQKIMKFWLDAGVGGFHVCDVDLLVENHKDDSSEPRNYVNGTNAFLEKLRQTVDGYNKPGRERFLFATVKTDDGNLIKSYFGDGKKKTLNIVMPLMDKLNKNTDAHAINRTLDESILLEGKENPWIGLGLGNQYTKRVATRMGKSPDKLNAAHALQLLLPGTPFTYYGDEFGQYEGDDNTVATPKHHYAPMQWNNQMNAGFSAGKAWQSPNVDYRTNNVEAGTAHFITKPTPLQVFKDLVVLRQAESFQWGKTRVCAVDSTLFMFSRKATRFEYFVTFVNLGEDETDRRTVSLSNKDCVDSKAEGTVRFHSGDSSQVGKTLNFHDHPAAIKAGEVVVVEFAADDE